MWTLHISGPNLAPERRTLLPGASLCIGRADDSDLVLPSDCVSRRHARLSAGPDGLRVADLGSRNGTLLNKHALGSVSRVLTVGDAVVIGDYVIKVEKGPGEPRRASVPDGFITLRTSSLEQNPYVTQQGWRPSPNASAASPAASPAAPTVARDESYTPVLFQFAEQLAAGMDPSEFLEELIGSAEALTGFEGGLLVRTAEGAFVPAARTGKPMSELSWSHTILEAALDRRSVLFASHLSSDPRFNQAASVVTARHLHVLCAPVARDGEVLGAVYLSTRTAAPPSQDAVDFIGSLAQLAAAALNSLRCSGPGGDLRQRLRDEASFLHGALSELSRFMAGPSPASNAEEITKPRIDVEELEMRNLLAEAEEAARRLSAALARLPRARVDSPSGAETETNAAA